MNKSYSVKQLADLAKVSARTLHYYDQVGLLKPSRIHKNNYRFYLEKDLLTLQQILFFRELDFSVEEIKRIMTSPDFEIKQALQSHKNLIEMKKKRLSQLIQTIDKTIKKLNQSHIMKDEELYEGMSKKEIEELSAEAKQRWGNTRAYKESKEKVSKMSKEDWARIKAEADAIMRLGASLISKDVRSEEVQQFVASHYRHLANFYTPSLEMYRGLAEMYIADVRFHPNFEKYAPGFTQFMHDAMIAYCELQK